MNPFRKKQPKSNPARLVVGLLIGMSLLYILGMLLGLVVHLAPYIVGLWFALALHRSTRRARENHTPAWLSLLLLPFFVLTDLCTVAKQASTRGERACKDLEREAETTALELDTHLVDAFNERYHGGIGGHRQARS